MNVASKYLNPPTDIRRAQSDDQKHVVRWHVGLTGKVALSMLILTVLISALLIWQTQQETNQLLFDSARAQARVFLIGVEREIQQQAPHLEPDRLQAIIARAITYEAENLDFSIEHLFVVNREGRVMAHNEGYHVGQDYSDHTYLLRAIQEDRAVAPGGLSFHVSDEEALVRPTIDVVIPLHLKGEDAPPSGAMEVELDVSKSAQILQSRYWGIRKTLLIKLMGLMGGLALLSLLAVRYEVIDRLQEMIQVATSISQGNLRVRAPDMGSDEIGSLAGTFNWMTDNLEQTITDLKETQLLTMTKLAELAEKRDEETGAHLQRLPRYCQVLAEELRCDGQYATLLDDDYVEDLLDATPLHDIGKVATPDAILLKPGKLTPEEFETMQEHTLVGADILSGADFLALARDIALAHHEKYDGSGYPNGWAGERIPLAARIVALADVYDALTSKRIYKDAFSHEKARAIIEQESSKHFDPNIVQAFLHREAEFRAIRQQWQS